MGTIGDKLTYLEETKTAIKNAIIEKGVEVSDSIEFREYANKIKEIQGASSDKVFESVKFDVKSSDLEDVQTYQTDTFNEITTANYTIPFPITVNNMIFNSYSELSQQFGSSNIIFGADFNMMSIYIKKNMIGSESQVGILSWDFGLVDFELYMFIKVK